MVLSNSSAQYAFLQTLTTTYVWMLANLQSFHCISSPQLYTDCSNTAQYFGNIPRLPDYNSLGNTGQTQTFQYTDYSYVTWTGISAQNFTNLSTNFTNAAVRALASSCLANSTCATAFKKTSRASQVLQALVKTNVNTIQNQLNMYDSKGYHWFPSTNYGFLTNAFYSVPYAGDEVYGVHNALVYGFVAGSVNASAYLQQLKLGQMLQGGGAMYESAIHSVAIGSWSSDYGLQSNINLTGTQLYTNVDSGQGLDTRAIPPRSLQSSRRRETYQNKWEVWKAEGKGHTVANKNDLFQAFKDEALLRSGNGSEFFSNSFCSPSTSLIDGINWLSSLVNTGCKYESFLSGAASLFSAWQAADAALVGLARLGYGKAALGVAQDYADTAAGTLTMGVIGACGNGYQGYPCYPGSSTAYSFGNSVGTIVSLALDVSKFSTPVGAVLGGADIFCALAPQALNFYQQDYQCCKAFCSGPACQSSANGCTQGTGIC